MMCLSLSALYGWFMPPEGLAMGVKVLRGSVLFAIGQENEYDKKYIPPPADDGEEFKYTYALRAGSEL